jgi:general secretion pathway protein B
MLEDDAGDKPAKRPRKTAKPVEKKRAESAAATQVSAAEMPTPALRELPDAIQREVPAMTIGGYIYSGSKADRSVLINNRLLHEGEEVAPGFKIEKLMPNGMVLNYKGTRFRSGY